MSSISNMAPALPDDILHLFCEELALQERFDTLFNCACASRAFAVPALTNLYRSHHLAPVRGGGDDETFQSSAKQLAVQRWAILWRSIIASSLNDTLFPYCRYIKMLDLRDLRMLFEDTQFKGKVTKYFFSGLLSRFHSTMQVAFRSGNKITQLDIVKIIDAVGEVVTQHTPMLDKISGKLLSHALVRWAPRLPRLETLELFDGTPLEDELVHTTIHEHCPQFNSLSIFEWAADDRDQKLAKFLSAIRPQSLKVLELIRDIGAGPETFLALNAHSKSLTELKLCISDDALPHLSLLHGCTAIEVLKIEVENGTTNLEKTQNDVFLETIDWLRQCSSLRRLTFQKFLSAPSLVAPLLLEDKIKLQQLQIRDYIVTDNRVFHQALAHQKYSLRDLSLDGDTDSMFRDDVEILVDALTQLTELRELRLVLLHEVLQDEHLISIIENLPKLEDLDVSGLEMKDGVLASLANLHNLRNVAFTGISKFTTDGLFDFIERLGPGNQGIRVVIDMADPDTMLTDEEVALVRESLMEKVGGTLEYPWRDPDGSEFEGESD